METEVTVTETVEIDVIGVAIETATELLSDDKGYITWKGGARRFAMSRNPNWADQTPAQRDAFACKAMFLMTALRIEIAETLRCAGMEEALVTEVVRLTQPRSYRGNDGRVSVTPSSLFINDVDECRRRISKSGNIAL